MVYIKAILNCGYEKLKEVFKQPLILEAFEKACNKVIDEEELLDHYTSQGLTFSKETTDGENMATCLQKYFDDIDFPTPEKIAEILMDAWKNRKNSLGESEANMFFSLSDEEVRPIIKKLANYFFQELAQYDEFIKPTAVQITQNKKNHA